MITSHSYKSHLGGRRLFVGLLAAFAFLAMTGCKPDVTSSTKGIRFGEKQIAWNTKAFLSPTDAFAFSGGRCAFDIEYELANRSGVPALPAFWNRLRTGTDVVTQQSGLTLEAGETRVIRTQGYLAPGTHELTLTLDDEDNVVEANEKNNKLSLTIELKGPCVEQQACKTFQGFGRYDLRIGCDKVELDGKTYVVTRRGEELIVDGHTIARGIYRKTRPWLYLHGVDGDVVDLTFESGRKETYPMYTGLTAAIFSVYKNPWEMGRSTAAAFDEGFWLVSHRWSETGIFFDLQQNLGGDPTRWNLVRGDVFVAGDGSVQMIPEIATSMRIESFDPDARVAMVRFIRS